MQSPLYLGIDVAKAELVIACSHNSFSVRTVANTPAAIEVFLKALPHGSRLAMEATGSYHQALADRAVQHGHLVYVLNPRDTRHYAKAVGLRAKTDRVDAQLIARYLVQEAVHHAHPYVPPTAAQREMDQLLKRRAKLTSLKTALRLTCQEVPSLHEEMKAGLAQFDRLLNAIDARISALTNTIPERRAHCDRLQSIAGIGPLTSAWLANLLDRVAFKSSDALVAFTGLDPRPCDSGRRRGRRRLSKRGPSEGRRLLFNAAMAGMKSPVWAPFYARYRQQGWPATAALMILARKMLRVALALFKSQTTFNPAFVTLKP